MTQDSTMALGADFISDLFETSNTLAHKGVKGMKWGKHKAQPPTAPSSTLGELVNKYNETPEEMKARKAMVDEYLKTAKKDSGEKKAGGKAGGKGGGKGGGGKKKGGGKGGAKKGSKKPAGSGGSGGSRASSNNAPAKTYEPRKNSYAPRKAIADILASVPKNLGPKAPKASVQAIIDKINASVDARKALQHKLLTKSEGGDMSGASDELVTLDNMDDILAHYGILGMKWGVRNDDRGSGRPQGAAIKKKAPKSDIKSAPTRQIGEKYRVGTTQRRVLAVHTTKDPNDPTKTLTTTYGIDEKDYQLKLKNGEIQDLDKFKDLRTAKITNPETGDTISIKVDPFSTKFDNETGMFTTTSEKDYFTLENALPKIGLNVNDMNASYVKVREEYNNSKKSSDNNSISDEELRTVINRLQLEKTYKQLMAERNPVKPKVSHTIKKILADSAKDSAKQGLTQIGAAAIKYASAQALKKAGMPEFSKAVMKTDEKKEKTTP